MGSRAKSNLLFAFFVVCALLLGWFHVPTWAIVLGMVGVVPVVIAYAVISGALQQRKAGHQYQSAKQLMRQGDLQAALDKLLQCRPVVPHARVVVDLDVALGHALLGDLGCRTGGARRGRSPSRRQDTRVSGIQYARESGDRLPQ
jgi:hypothetical protein